MCPSAKCKVSTIHGAGNCQSLAYIMQAAAPIWPRSLSCNCRCDSSPSTHGLVTWLGTGSLPFRCPASQCTSVPQVSFGVLECDLPIQVQCICFAVALVLLFFGRVARALHTIAVPCPSLCFLCFARLTHYHGTSQAFRQPSHHAWHFLAFGSCFGATTTHNPYTTQLRKPIPPNHVLRAWVAGWVAE